MIDSSEKMENIMNSLDRDTWVTPSHLRPQRATGRALEMMIDLLTILKIKNSRIVLLTSGACTTSKGKMASIKYEEFIRKHVDLEEN